MDKVSRSYQDELLKALTDPVEAAEYLNAALDEGSSEVFVLALQNVAKAQALKKAPPQSQENSGTIPHTLPDGEDLELSNLSEILESVGLRFAANG
jgi:DNA-binding phage protein